MPTGVYIVVDRAKDMLFVLMEDALRGECTSRSR
jgi:hypothetical protein